MVFTSAVVYSMKKHLSISESDSKPKRMNFLFAKLTGTSYPRKMSQKGDSKALF